MKIFITMILVACLASTVFAGGDTIYNKKQDTVQLFAPNFFQSVTAVQTSIDLKNTMAFEMDSTADCKVYLAPTNSKVGRIAIREFADISRIRGQGYGIGFAIYSGCTGTYSSMKGDSTGQ